jgi:hypothetical protein
MKSQNRKLLRLLYAQKIKANPWTQVMSLILGVKMLSLQFPTTIRLDLK